MKKRFLGGLAAGLLLLAACQNSNKPASADALKAGDSDAVKKITQSPTMNAGTGNFDIETPSGWKRIDTTISGIKATLLMAPLATGAGIQTNINVVSESMNNTSLDSYFDLNVSNMGKFMQNFSIAGKGEKEVNGTRSKWIQYSHNPNGSGLEAICYIIPGNGIAYVITCTAAKGQLEQYKPQIEEVLGSFRVRQ
jgi:hypothetical protein